MTELGTTTGTVLRATAPFDLACSLRAMESFAPCSGDQLVVDGRVRRAFLHPTDPARAVVTEVVGRDDGVAGVHLTVFSDEALTPEETAAVGERVSDWLGLPADYTSSVIDFSWVAPHGTPGLMAVTFETPQGEVTI